MVHRLDGESPGSIRVDIAPVVRAGNRIESLATDTPVFLVLFFMLPDRLAQGIRTETFLIANTFKSGAMQAESRNRVTSTLESGSFFRLSALWRQNEKVSKVDY
jgi:hypothetical protein